MAAAQTATREIFDAITLLQPFDIDLLKIRYGSPGDGGYVFADKVRPEQPILSFGVSDNCDLEYDFAERGHKVFMFDPSVSGPPKPHKNFIFHKIGVAAEDNDDGSFLSLASCMKICALSDRFDIILKIDTEGAEYPTFSSVKPELLLQFEQIALEVHWLSRLAQDEFRYRFVKCLENVNKYFINFHVHANNCAPLNVVGGKQFANGHLSGGLTVADVLEISYVRRDLVRSSPSKTFYPSSLDYPNHPHYPDHILCFYPFLPTEAGAKERLGLMIDFNELRLR